MYEKKIGEVRNEIENAQKYLEELTTEVMIRKLRDGTGNIFISFPRRGIIIQFAFCCSLF